VIFVIFTKVCSVFLTIFCRDFLLSSLKVPQYSGLSDTIVRRLRCLRRC